jgi:dihydropteroate synthase
LKVLLRARQFEFKLPRPAIVMGVVNVTPDSFSDGGKFLDPAAAVNHALALAKQGAEIIDIGGESTRPQAVPVSEEEELHRVMPVLEALQGKLAVPVSIDTMKPKVARQALAAGASIVNDVAASRQDPEMWEVVAEARAGYVCVHMQGTPQTMQGNPVYHDVVAEVAEFFRERRRRLLKSGLQPEQIIFDPGIGFGKKIEHNLALLGALKGLARLDRPLLLGVSRKSFLSKISGAQPQQRLAAGLSCACLAIEAGVQLIRTHDVPETLQAIRMTEAIVLSRNA